MAYPVTITNLLNMWNEIGVFAYVLPFLMIFAIVFGILNKTNVIGDNKGVQVTIALAIGLLSLQFDYVSNFFAAIFPYAGIGLAVLLIALILLGLGTEDDENKNKIWMGLGIVIFIIVLITAFSDYNWLGGRGYQLTEHIPLIAIILIVGFVFMKIIKSDKPIIKSNN